MWFFAQKYPQSPGYVFRLNLWWADVRFHIRCKFQLRIFTLWIQTGSVFISVSWTSDARYIIFRLGHHLLSSGRHPMQNDACSFRYYLVGTIWSHNRGRTEFRTGETLSINYKGRVSNTRMNRFLIILYILMRLLLSQIIFESSSVRRLNYLRVLSFS